MAKSKTQEPELSDILADELNKYSKSQKVAYFLNQNDSPTQIDSWVSFGNDVLDLVVSNRPNGGAPVGRIIEVTGMEQSGKSLLSAHLLATTQRAGGVAVMIDTETAVSTEFLEAIGVDTSKLLYVSADSVEQIFEFIETIITKIRGGDRDRLVTIVVDSVAAASTKVELEADYDQAGYATQKAIIISKALRKITNMIGRQKILLSFTNQLRVNMNAMAFGDPYTTSGGKALQFHASVRLRLKPKGQIKNADKRIVGMKVQCVVVKNRLGPPKRTMEFDIFFDRGIDNYGSWLSVLKDAKVIKKAGAYNKVVNESTGEEHQFYAKDFADILETSEGLKEQLYKALCKEMIMEYAVDTTDPDTLVVDEISE
jgi:recombination protein RecA